VASPVTVVYLLYLPSGLCDNTIWSKRVATDQEGGDGYTAFIREHNRLVAEDSRYVGSIVPIRDGVMAALRIE
jgi:caffeoyl-CoA O-methyltransferase